jgi:ketosteroid isomerase-like protein
MTTSSDPEATIRAFLVAFSSNDLEGMRALLADDFVGRVTTPDGGVRELGADGYVGAVAQMDVPTANLQLEVTDVTLVGPAQVMVMVEVHAHRGDRSLHNFSGQLATVEDGRLSELSMVEALPAESDRFWAS